MAERWQTSEARVAAVFFRDSSGTPATGLTPTATVLHKDGTGSAPAGTVAEVGSGFYRVSLSAAPAKDLLVQVDGGGSLTTTRYIALEVPVGGYVDNLDATVSSRATAAAVTAVATAISTVQADTDALQVDTASLLARLTAARALLLDQLDPALVARIARLADVQVTVSGSATVTPDVRTT